MLLDFSTKILMKIFKQIEEEPEKSKNERKFVQTFFHSFCYLFR